MVSSELKEHKYRLTESSNLDELYMSGALAINEVGMTSDGLGDRVGDVLFVLRSLAVVGSKPRSSEESSMELEGELGAAFGVKIS